MDIHTLDLAFQGVPHAIASYLLVGRDGPVLVETGPGSTHDALVGALAAHGFAPDDVRHVLVTHIHLDHAGAAGWWAANGARVYVHHVGAPHLIDPGKLLASARRIYGDRMDTLWGDIVAAPAENVVALEDGAVVDAGGLGLVALDTPGHARHHMVFRLGDVAFTGDAAGVRIPGQALVDLPAPPPEFDREAWDQTIDRIGAERFRAIYPTHFGRVDDVASHLRDLRSLLAEATGFVRGLLAAGADRETMIHAYRRWGEDRMAAAGVADGDPSLYELANPFAMSVDGIARYWRKRGVGA